jgi:hypothetical protein
VKRTDLKEAYGTGCPGLREGLAGVWGLGVATGDPEAMETVGKGTLVSKGAGSQDAPRRIRTPTTQTATTRPQNPTPRFLHHVWNLSPRLLGRRARDPRRLIRSPTLPITAHPRSDDSRDDGPEPDRHPWRAGQPASSPDSGQMCRSIVDTDDGAASRSGRSRGGSA